LPKRCHTIVVGLRRTGTEETDHRHRRLRAHRERACGCSAGCFRNRAKLAPSFRERNFLVRNPGKLPPGSGSGECGYDCNHSAA
jgi:hypothetical protein